MDEKFVITIARGYGSGGRTIGKMLSKNLSIPFYDRDLVYMASEESGINVKLFGQNDESVKKSIFSPEVLEEDTRLNQVTLTLKMISKLQEVQENSNSL